MLGVDPERLRHVSVLHDPRFLVVIKHEPGCLATVPPFDQIKDCRCREVDVTVRPR